MIITDEKEREMLLNDIPFYNREHGTYCLGKTLEEAGEIIRQILRDDPKFDGIMAQFDEIQRKKAEAKMQSEKREGNE